MAPPALFAQRAFLCNVPIMQHTLLIYLRGVLIVLATLLVVVVIWLQTGYGLNRVLEWGISRSQLLDDATVQIGSARANLFGSVEASELALINKEGAELVRIDRFLLRFDAVDLIGGDIHLLDFDLGPTTVKLRQDKDGDWDLIRVFARDTPREEEDSSSSASLRLDQLSIREIDLIAECYSERGDSTYRVHDVNADLSNFRIDDALHFELNALYGAIFLPDQPDSVVLRARAALTENVVTVDELNVASPRSEVFGSGRIALPLHDSLFQETHFALKADPIAFDDIRIILPGLRAGHTAQIVAAVEGAEDGLRADASIQLSDGASLTAAGEIFDDQGAGRRYTLNADITQFNPQLIDTGQLPAGSLTSTLYADLQGTSLDNLTGRTHITLFGSRIEEQRIDSTYLEGDWQQGRISLRGETGFPAGRFSLAGATSPFAEPPTYDLSGAATQLDLAALTDSAYAGVLNMAWAIEGKGFAREDADASAVIRFAPSRLNLLPVNTGLVEATLLDQRLQFDADLGFSRGAIDIAGLVDLASPLSLSDLEGSLTRLDVAALLGDTTRSAISGTIAGNAELGASPSGALEINLNDTQWGPYLIDSGAFEGALDDREVRFTARTDVDEGRIELEGMLRAFDDSLSFSISEGALSNVDLSTVTRTPSLQSRLNGAFTAEGTRSQARGVYLDGSLDLDRSRFNNQRIESASVRVDLRPDTLISVVEMNLPAGEVALAGQLRDWSAVPSYTLSEGRFSGIDIGSFAGDSTLSSSLTGLVSLNGEGFDPGALTANGELRLEPSSFNEAVIHNGALTFEFDRGTGALRSSLDIDEGSLDVETDIQRNDSLFSYRFDARADQVDVDRILGNDSLQAQLNATLQGSGTGMDMRTLHLEGAFVSKQSSFDDIVLEESNVEFTLDRGVLDVDTLHARSNVASVAGSGRIALFDDTSEMSSDFDFNVDAQNISPLAPLIGADQLDVFEASIRTRIYGSPGILRYDARIIASGIVYNDFRIGDTSTRVTGELSEDRSLRAAEVVGDLESASIPGFVLDEVLYEASFTGQTVDFDLDARIDDARNAQLRGTLSFFDELQKVALETANLKLDEDQWRLSQPAEIRIGRTIEVDSFRIAVDPLTAGPPSQYIALNGIIDREGEQDLTLDVTNFKIGTVAELAGFEGLDGPVSALVTFEGPAASPAIDGSLEMDIISFGREAGDLDLALTYDSLELSIDATLRDVNGQTMTATGYLPVDLTLAAPQNQKRGAVLSQNMPMEGDVDLNIRSDSLAIGWLLPFLDRSLLNQLDGQLVADFNVQGTADQPELSGSGRLIDGLIRSPIVGIAYRDINADLAFSNNVVSINNAVMRAGEGGLSMDGTIELSDLTNAGLNITIEADQFSVIDTREYRSRTSGNLSFTGTLREPKLTGTIQLLNTDVYFENSGSDQANLNVQLTEEDLLMLEREFGIRPTAGDTTTFDFYEALAMDINIELGRDTWIRSRTNPEMNVQFDGRLDLAKEPFEDQQVFGAIEVNPDRSYITQFGKRFEIVSGTITFNGPIDTPRLDFEARYEVPSRRSQDNAVTVFLDVDGTLEQIDLTLRSEPTMELVDIVSYVATGQPASEALQLGGLGNQGAGSIAVSSGVGLLSGAIESLVQDSGLELDVIQIEPLNNARGATITAGKYVTPHLFTAVSQPIGASDLDGSSEENGTVVTLELELLDSLLLRLLGGESVMQINVLWHYAY